jgi:5-methylcytosine-specific restriction endonuclease McrA
MKTYSEKLKDPRWQRKRLEIMQRDGFACRVCDDTTSTLHVHHIRYIKGREPWEYKDFYFVTLCADCHLAEENEIKAKVPPPQTVNVPKLFAEDEPEDLDDDLRREATPEELDAFFSSLKSMLDEIKP